MSNTIKIYITSLLVCLMIFSISIPISAAAVDPYKKQQQTSQQIKDTKNILNQTAQQKQRALNELNALYRDIEKTNKEITELEKQLSSLEKNIKETEKDVALKENDVEERTHIFEERFKQSYQVGNVSYLEILFQSSSVSDFLTRFEFLKRLAKNDTLLLAELEAEREELESQKQKLVEKQQAAINAKKSRQQKTQQLQIASSRSQSMVKTIEQDQASYQKMLDELERESKLIAEEIRRLQSNTGERPSILAWPTPGHTRITSAYGNRIHPITRRNNLHTGLDIGAPMGANVVAPSDGKVIYAGWRGGYGNTVIVDHGGGMSTLHAHLSVFNCKVGDVVKRGQTIAKVGSTGNSTGPHLHIEVLINGNHTNPTKYISSP